MSEGKRDLIAVEKILKYCREIDKTVALFGRDNGVP